MSLWRAYLAAGQGLLHLQVVPNVHVGWWLLSSVIVGGPCTTALTTASDREETEKLVEQQQDGGTGVVGAGGDRCTDEGAFITGVVREGCPRWDSWISE